MHVPAASALALTVGVLWWWAVLRLVLAPEESGAVEGAVAVGGWGLGLLPVHCVPGPVRKARRSAGAVGGGGGGGAEGPGGAGTAAGSAVTRASTLRRSGEGSDPS
ncbi:hypothetical protein ACFVFI_14595 [Streptomyces sp. NPDC057705]|uniref:hypothetical protein n=1 Tax=Streptomyces sp. NPDC057705 TaxID=3346222 RepID=UPI0036B2F413